MSGLSGLYKVRRAALGMAGLTAALPEVGCTSSLLSDAGDMMGLQPMLDRLDPPGLCSSEDVISSAGLVTGLGEDVVKTGCGMVYWYTPGDTCWMVDPW